MKLSYILLGLALGAGALYAMKKKGAETSPKNVPQITAYEAAPTSTLDRTSPFEAFIQDYDADRVLGIGDLQEAAAKLMRFGRYDEQRAIERVIMQTPGSGATPAEQIALYDGMVPQSVIDRYADFGVPIIGIGAYQAFQEAPAFGIPDGGVMGWYKEI